MNGWYIVGFVVLFISFGAALVAWCLFSNQFGIDDDEEQE